MGLLTDFFIATSEERNLVDLERGPAGKLPTVQAKGFDPVELVSFEARVKSVLEHAVSQPIVVEQGEATVVALAGDFRDALAGMDDAAIKQFGEDWLLSDDEVSILSDVADLARHGKSQLMNPSAHQSGQQPGPPTPIHDYNSGHGRYNVTRGG